MKHDLFNQKPVLWREQNDLAKKIGDARKKSEKHQLVALLCESLARMTEKPRHRH